MPSITLPVTTVPADVLRTLQRTADTLADLFHSKRTFRFEDQPEYVLTRELSRVLTADQAKEYARRICSYVRDGQPVLIRFA